MLEKEKMDAYIRSSYHDAMDYPGCKSTSGNEKVLVVLKEQMLKRFSQKGG